VPRAGEGYADQKIVRAPDAIPRAFHFLVWERSTQGRDLRVRPWPIRNSLPARFSPEADPQSASAYRRTATNGLFGRGATCFRSSRDATRGTARGPPRTDRGASERWDLWL